MLKKEYKKPMLNVGYFTDVLTASGGLFDEKTDNDIGANSKWWGE